jgi:hypothetical protein
VRQASGETLIEDRSQPSTLQCEPEVAAGLAAKIPRGFSADIEAIVAIDALAGPASELPLIPSWHSGSMVTVLRGTRRPAAYCVRSTVKEQDLLKAGGQVPPTVVPSCIRPAPSQRPRLCEQAPFVAPLVRPPGQQSGPYGCRDDGGLSPVCPQEKRWKAVKAIRGFDGDWNDRPSSLGRS